MTFANHKLPENVRCQSACWLEPSESSACPQWSVWLERYDWE